MNFTLFELKDGSNAKAYHHLKNLEYIETHGLNLNFIFSNLVNGEMPSITDCKKILFHALWSDIVGIKERADFVTSFFSENGAFKASDIILSFVLDALKMPAIKEGEEAEKKT